jgi:dTDP-4-amino-4,6-dideoxygalactose transaminase
VSRKYIPYSTQTISQQDINAVVSALKSELLTGGKTVQRFEKAMARYCNVQYGAAVSSGTAALHCAMRALNLEKDAEVIVPSISFVATANAVLYEHCKPVFCDVSPNTLLINPSLIENLITSRTRAIVAVDYAGQLCDYRSLRSICKKNNLYLIADSCHSLGAESIDGKCGSLADMTAFSFHPVKQMTTGEGGMVMTDSAEFHERVSRFRNHEMSDTPAERLENNNFHYEIDSLGYNYRLTDIQSALGFSQLAMLDEWVAKRQEIASLYTSSFADHPSIEPLAVRSVKEHAYHLYVVKVPERDAVFSAMRKLNIGVNVHYLPIHLHRLYQERFGTYEGLCPVAEQCYFSILSLPIYPGLSKTDQLFVMNSLIDIVDAL